ncbi:hypothetical protein CONPUDRAFT_135324 [Coniophora puteana RWD-64-598 SS2]|uniref:Uncharacterized protein n=1 Tax=Coniophora puteana (strain RWD-64-598) TaxID=741705 RepID=A0A5M3N2S6_CONPW|nr:uncharacterized protein CONPUDRAFT_135324 [Coniophora puteana RWD-64-598 SS2]EIW85689.1 hypothetical protein CONPUDRAFT_135324 [Coniophora puteana RWD-64-598 SS2]
MHRVSQRFAQGYLGSLKSSSAWGKQTFSIRPALPHLANAMRSADSKRRAFAAETQRRFMTGARKTDLSFHSVFNIRKTSPALAPTMTRIHSCLLPQVHGDS